MYRYFDSDETSKDKTYQKVMSQFSSYMEHLPTEEDRQLLSKMFSDSCRKYCKSIMAKEQDDPSLIMPMIMALLVDQQSVIDSLRGQKVLKKGVASKSKPVFGWFGCQRPV
jgi:hypothetical protein